MGTKELEQLARNARISVLDMVTKAQSSHIGAAYSIIEILVMLYSDYIGQNDKFILSKGHAATGLYAVLAEFNLLKKTELSSYSQEGSILTGHVSHKIPNVELSTGSLGHGLPVGCGMALSKKLNQSDSRVFVIIGDGEQNEGSIWESAMFASQHKLNNIVVIVDANNWQGLDRPDNILQMTSLKDKWKSFGWDCYEVNGHSFSDLKMTFNNLDSTDKPKVIIAKTVKGKGVSFMEDTLLWHYRSPRGDEYDNALRELQDS